jgi:hypothetical protein
MTLLFSGRPAVEGRFKAVLFRSESKILTELIKFRKPVGVKPGNVPSSRRAQLFRKENRYGHRTNHHPLLRPKRWKARKNQDFRPHDGRRAGTSPVVAVHRKWLIHRSRYPHRRWNFRDHSESRCAISSRDGLSRFPYITCSDSSTTGSTHSRTSIAMALGSCPGAGTCTGVFHGCEMRFAAK